MNSSCQKRRRRGPSPSKTEGEGASRERGTETQRSRDRLPEMGRQRSSIGGQTPREWRQRDPEKEGDRGPERRGQRASERRDRDSGQKLKPRPGKTHRTTNWGARAPCHQESQNKGPRRPLPQFRTTPIWGGAGRQGRLPSGPRPRPFPPLPLRRGLGSNSSSQ